MDELNSSEKRINGKDKAGSEESDEDILYIPKKTDSEESIVLRINQKNKMKNKQH